LELTRLRGFQDSLGADARAMSLVEERARAIFERYLIKEIRIPVLERTQLYVRSSGETSDIVEKQMYSFTDRDEGETVVALRPEGTPGVVRAYVEAGLDRTDPEQRLFYSGPMFRRERPQKGRYRQFYQFGVEVFGPRFATRSSHGAARIGTSSTTTVTTASIATRCAFSTARKTRRLQSLRPTASTTCATNAARISTPSRNCSTPPASHTSLTRGWCAASTTTRARRSR
jgi:hypothetical protein